MNLFHNMKLSVKVMLSFIMVAIVSTSMGFIAAVQIKKSFLIVSIAVIASAIIALVFGRFLVGIINDFVRKLSEAANKLSVGDINIDIEYHSKDEIGKLMKAFDAIAVTIKEQSEAVKKIASGDLGIELNAKSENDILSKNLTLVINNIKSLVADTTILVEAAAEGKLTTRADVSRHNGEYRKIVEGINKTLDIVIEPFDEANQVLYKMSINDLNTQMKGKYNGVIKDFAESINNLHARLVNIQKIFVDMAKGDITDLEMYKRIGRRSENDKMMPAAIKMMGTIQRLTNEVRSLASSAVNGDLSARGNADEFEGGYREIVEGMNDTIDAFTNPINDSKKVLEKFALNDFSLNMKDNYKGEFNVYANSINDLHKRLLSIQRAFNGAADGDISLLNEFRDLKKRCENDQLLPALIRMLETNQNLFNEVRMLTENAIEGKLDVRGDASKFKGNNKTIIEQVNKLIDVLNAPMNEASEVLYKMSVNDLTEKMTGKYNGMLKNFAESINDVHVRLVSIQTIFKDLSKGDISGLEEYKKIGKRSENDKMLPSIVVAMNSIKDLIIEARTLANLATKGDLSSRGNTDKFEGGYKEIIEGMNSTMDAVVRPIQEASDVLQKMAKGDLTVAMTGDYKGEYSKIKDNLNLTISSFNDILNDISNSAYQVAAGSKQVSDGSQALSQGSTEQASSIEELSSSITQISAQTKQNAINANQANELSIDVKENATQGNEQMQEMLKAM
ncbi:HAMP domain-containing protein, partial [Clostridium thailandense]|uniref:HAMP domain-containing protein n=1 Tax=Clostridium thailandense TaxID=2794346 RepID=UPI0039899C04